MFVATLHGQGIPTLMKSRGAGQYLSIVMGYSIYSKDIYVPLRLETKARTIFNEIIGAAEDLPKPLPEANYGPVRIILLLQIASMILLLIYSSIGIILSMF
jgi:hypothetical protein